MSNGEDKRKALLLDAAAALRAGVVVTWTDWRRMSSAEKAARLVVVESAGRPAEKKNPEKRALMKRAALEIVEG